MRTRNQKLAGWISLVGALALLNYASRFSSGKPPPDTLYRYDTATRGAPLHPTWARVGRPRRRVLEQLGARPH